jgi:hypothetical protein
MLLRISSYALLPLIDGFLSIWGAARLWHVGWRMRRISKGVS